MRIEEFLPMAFPDENPLVLARLAAWLRRNRGTAAHGRDGLVWATVPGARYVIGVGGGRVDWSAVDAMRADTGEHPKRLYLSLGVSDERPHRGSIIRLRGYYVAGKGAHVLNMDVRPHPRAHINTDTLRAQGLDAVPPGMGQEEAFASLSMFLRGVVDEYDPGDRVQLIAWDAGRAGAFLRQWFALNPGGAAFGAVFGAVIDVQSIVAHRLAAIAWRSDLSLAGVARLYGVEAQPGADAATEELQRLYGVAQVFGI